MSAGSRQQHLWYTQSLLQEAMTFFGKRAISRSMPSAHGLHDVFNLVANQRRFVERDSKLAHLNPPIFAELQI
jgi:hypothetical protein